MSLQRSFAFSLLFALVFLVGCRATTTRPDLEPIVYRPAAQTPEALDGVLPTRNGPPSIDLAESAMRNEVATSDYSAYYMPILATQSEAAVPAIETPATGASATKKVYADWKVRVWGGAVGRTLERDNDTFQDPTFGTVGLSWEGVSFGLGVDAEYRFSKLLGLDLAVGYTNLEVEFTSSVSTGTQKDDLGVIPVWLALNFHVVNTEEIDFYLGPQIAYFFYLNDLSYQVPGVGEYKFKTDNEFPSLGFLIGADYWLGDNWGLNFAFRFQDADADSNHLLPLDPTFLTLGVTWRY